VVKTTNKTMKKLIKLSIIITIFTIFFSFKNSHAQLPDLRVMSITPSVVGGNLRLRIRIKNIGNRNAVGIFDNYIELNNLHEPSPNQHRIRTRTINGLGAGQSRVIIVTYPHAHVLSTDTKVTVVTDSKIVDVTESDETNNSMQVDIPHL
jgi:subtilase family serine protease